MCSTCRHYEKMLDVLERARDTDSALTREELDEVIETVRSDYDAFVDQAAEASLS